MNLKREEQVVQINLYIIIGSFDSTIAKKENLLDIYKILIVFFYEKQYKKRKSLKED